ncbi:MAG: hypothetical protein ACRYGP_03880, partial [Janthinobacterium lividum]
LSLNRSSRLLRSFQERDRGEADDKHDRDDPEGVAVGHHVGFTPGLRRDEPKRLGLRGDRVDDVGPHRMGNRGEARLGERALRVISSATTETCMCSRRSIIVDSMAMPMEPPRLHIMLENAELSAVSRGWRPAVDTCDSGTVNSGWPAARSSCGRIKWSMPTS